MWGGGGWGEQLETQELAENGTYNQLIETIMNLLFIYKQHIPVHSYTSQTSLNMYIVGLR